MVSSKSRQSLVKGGNSSSTKKLEEYQTMKMSSASASMWLNKRYNTAQQDSDNKLVPKAAVFAPKIVRQCNLCQVLYTTFHACQEDKGDESIWSEKHS